ncbi:MULTISPECIES: hypothetical protein [unclassified Curtobacterium]|uniref:hypothetical protein n=1 Tax=unclassified Curtobacterium TaxID=257496 RepID=UPI000D86F66E|nr:MULTISPECIES: hypothetical protein [unclassified Curtobacterium]PYY41605.1 hypothetical protein DEJ32_04470 [Curtobacterium sp. MCPF17_046]WIB15259.1 hypothetical protein DEJ34_14145 [Curtobacterium sp. MCPF17_050]
MTSKTVVAVSGALVVTAYAALLAVNALVLDPLAAVPGKSLSEIYATVDAMGMNSRQDVVGVLVTAGIGVVLAVGFAIAAIWKEIPVPVALVCHLALVACGAGPVFQSGFFLGMDVADSFGVSGGAHGMGAAVLYGTSLAALVAIPAVLFLTMVQTLRRARAAA